MPKATDFKPWPVPINSIMVQLCNLDSLLGSFSAGFHLSSGNKCARQVLSGLAVISVLLLASESAALPGSAGGSLLLGMTPFGFCNTGLSWLSSLLFAAPSPSSFLSSL